MRKGSVDKFDVVSLVELALTSCLEEYARLVGVVIINNESENTYTWSTSLYTSK